MIRLIPKKYRKIYNRRKTSRKAAIRSQCLDCCAYSEKEVQICSDKECPLYKWRLSG